MLSPDTSLAGLALAEVQAQGGSPDDCTSALWNIMVGESLGQLKLDVAGDTCTGFTAWIRLTFEQLLEVCKRNIRVFRPEDNSPYAPVLFVMEQMNLGPARRLFERRHFLAAEPGVQMLCGWRANKMLKLRVHQVRH